jgi:probable phosphoglycerate mutase
MTRLVLVRHGQAQVHVDGILGGEVHCRGLSDLGRRQVAALRDRLKRTGELGEVDALYASTLPRAVETAEILAPALGDLEILRERELREFDPGEADGLTWEEFQERYPPPDVWDPHVPRTPGSESWAAFGERVERALTGLVAAHEGDTVVVACHGGVIEHAFHLWGLSTLGGLALDIENASITEFLWAEPWPWHQPGPPAWRLVRHNDAAHLHDVV